MLCEGPLVFTLPHEVLDSIEIAVEFLLSSSKFSIFCFFWINIVPLTGYIVLSKYKKLNFDDRKIGKP
jgi:hypothetical protein